MTHHSAHHFKQFLQISARLYRENGGYRKLYLQGIKSRELFFLSTVTLPTKAKHFRLFLCTCVSRVVCNWPIQTVRI